MLSNCCALFSKFLTTAFNPLISFVALITSEEFSLASTFMLKFMVAITPEESLSSNSKIAVPGIWKQLFLTFIVIKLLEMLILSFCSTTVLFFLLQYKATVCLVISLEIPFSNMLILKIIESKDFTVSTVR